MKIWNKCYKVFTTYFVQFTDFYIKWVKKNCFENVYYVLHTTVQQNAMSKLTKIFMSENFPWLKGNCLQWKVKCFTFLQYLYQATGKQHWEEEPVFIFLRLFFHLPKSPIYVWFCCRFVPCTDSPKIQNNFVVTATDIQQADDNLQRETADQN